MQDSVAVDRLPRGITGFRDRNENATRVDPAEFKAACYVVAREAGGSVATFDDDLLARNYYRAAAQLRGQSLSIACNAFQPWVVIAAPISQGQLHLHFLDAQLPSRLIAELTEFRPLDASWLAGELTSQLLSELGPAELEQIAYWKPSRIGDVIFNSWD
jgi:hypothetical protein